MGGNKRITQWKNGLCFQELEQHFYTLELLHLQDESKTDSSSLAGNRGTSSMVSLLDERKLSALLMHQHLDSLTIIMNRVVNIVYLRV